MHRSIRRLLRQAIWVVWNLLYLSLGLFPGFEVLHDRCEQEHAATNTKTPTFLHQSRWLLAMLIAISRKSATFCRWKRSKSA